MDNIKVLLADDHTIVRKGLRSLLDGEKGIRVVAEAEDGREAIKKAEKLHPDVVVMDITMPGLNGIEATRQLKKRFPQMKILILSMHKNEEYILQTLQAGASGYLIKKAAPSELVLAIHAAQRNEFFLSPQVSKRVIENYVLNVERISVGENKYKKLTAREREVLQLIAEGHKNRDIAELLSVSVKTVEVHKANMMDKLNIRSTAKLAQYAIRKELLPNDF
jgi:DNA-binding NarL/FixJ family response regulator